MPKRRAALLRLALVAAALPACRSRDAEHDSPSRERPNLVYVMADDLGWAELGCYGQEKIQTPNIDRIASEGIRFTQHYAGAPVCAPSRCVLMTGKHSGHTIVRDNWERGGWGPDELEGQYPLPPNTQTLGTLLQAAGYATAAIGKWGLGGPGTTGAPNRQGFDLFFGYLCQRVAHNYYPTHLWRNEERVELPGNEWGNLTGATYSQDLMADEALGFVRAHRDEPFFLYWPFTIPHLALQAPAEEVAAYVGEWDDPPYDGKKGYLPHPTPRAAYAAMVTRMDRDVGRLLDLLSELGLDERTVVLFSSDNGATYDIGGANSPFFESCGPLRGNKGSVYEGGLRVPLVARWPGHIPPGRTSDHLSAFQDVLPTLVELAGAPPPADIDGLSFAPTLLGRPGQPEHEHLYFEFPGYGGQQALRMGSWKAVRRDIKKGNTAIALYDLESDIGETTDLAADRPDVVAEVEAAFRAEHVRSEAFPLPPLDPVPAPAE